MSRTVSCFSFLSKAPPDVKKSFREEGGTVEEHLVKECPAAFLDEAFPACVTADGADGHGMVRNMYMYIATSAIHYLYMYMYAHTMFVYTCRSL